MRYVRDGRKSLIDVKRNRLCELARGDVIVTATMTTRWRRAVFAIRSSSCWRQARTCAGSNGLYSTIPPSVRRGNTCIHPTAAPWVYGATLCYTEAFWRRNPFPPIGVGEDSRFRLGQREQESP